MRIYSILCLVFLFVYNSFAQTGIIQGRVINDKNNEPLEFATVQIQGTSLGAKTSIEGAFTIKGIQPGFHKIVVSMVGFETKISEELQVLGNQTTFIDIMVSEASTTLREVFVSPNLLLRPTESPVSVLTLGVHQIEKSAGANRDVSKLVQILPGVGATAPNRNDLIIRGGGPTENVFYLDGVEIPVINHFATQGASGGVVGIINPDFVREISFYTGAFPANRPNTLSSVMEIKQKDGSRDRLHTKVAVGASDAGITLDGPLGKDASFIISTRQSYLQWLFKVIDLPFLPTYNDFQLKYKWRINPYHEITMIGIGAIDNMRLNRNLEQTGTEAQKYLLSYLPEYSQWNYTFGLSYKHYGKRFVDSWILSRNMMRNGGVKYRDNDKSASKISDYQSDEAEIKLRYERKYTTLPIKLNFGAGIKYSNYVNDVYRLQFISGNVVPFQYRSSIDLLSYQVFLQASNQYLNNRFKISLGVNLVGNTYTASMSNPLKQLSPRLSLSYSFSKDFDLNANIGRYAMPPSYTTMGYRNSEGNYVNRSNGLKYITSNQAILGMEYHPGNFLRFSLEGFYKQYSNYPISLTDGISLASKGVDYGQVGDEAVMSTGDGRAYGVEVVAKLMGWHDIDLTATYTLFRSEFTDKNGIYRPSSWDTRHILNLTTSYKLPKGWYISARWRYIGGAPYSPIDVERSTNKAAWSITNQAYTDYERFNTLRLADAHQLDVRLDKEFYFKHWMLNLYLDVQNAYISNMPSKPIYTNRDTEGRVMDDPTSPDTKQLLRTLVYYSGTILPTVGIMIKF
ncbi:TonB-dependent receptor [Prevotella melaninogenica]|uniref:TonB-dependent receptor n=1 Tax=Prevotella melaninogenica TaxID=28132 RepID=A0A7D4JNW6_9BACT|nr:TonB-dependent receptor [Prevotella melaninogenica]EFC73141.1 TonB-dependent receptor [Prevotella melaninogenica D18]QKH88239.1 TonB-dependent receptor [Prevotella melaninogenica]